MSRVSLSNHGYAALVNCIPIYLGGMVSCALRDGKIPVNEGTTHKHAHADGSIDVGKVSCNLVL